MAVLSRASILAKIASTLADNTTGDVSLGDFRTILGDIADSMLNPTSDTGTFGLYAWDGSTQYYTNQIVWYDGVWYKANTDPAVTGSFDPADWDALSNNVFVKSVTVPSVSVLALNATPYEIIPAVTGKSIVVLHSALRVNYNSAAYATDTSPYLITDTATIKQVDFPTALNATVTRTVNGVGYSYAGALTATDTSLIDNKDLKLTTTANPTAGDSDILVTVIYALV